jgi:hypothetical protein
MLALALLGMTSGVSLHMQQSFASRQRLLRDRSFAEHICNFDQRQLPIKIASTGFFNFIAFSSNAFAAAAACTEINTRYCHVEAAKLPQCQRVCPPLLYLQLPVHTDCNFLSIQMLSACISCCNRVELHDEARTGSISEYCHLGRFFGRSASQIVSSHCLSEIGGVVLSAALQGTPS